jgi:integration host factor subunit beta
VTAISMDRAIQLEKIMYINKMRGIRGYGRLAARRGTAMTKSELVRRMAELHPHLQHSDVERVVETVFQVIGEALAQGGRIEIRGFGSFTIRHRKARTGRNPRTGARIEVPRRSAPFFQTGKLLRAKLNEER